MIDYRIISRVNHLLEPIDAVSFDQKIKDNIKGQAYFLRALAYFDLVQYFGSVPIHLKPAKTQADTSQPLASVEDVYKQIIADAGQAVSLLPSKADQEPGRATKGAANTLLGNVYIVQKRWAEAEQVLKEVTGYELMPRYADVLNLLIRMVRNPFSRFNLRMVMKDCIAPSLYLLGAADNSRRDNSYYGYS